MSRSRRDDVMGEGRRALGRVVPSPGTLKASLRAPFIPLSPCVTAKAGADSGFWFVRVSFFRGHRAQVTAGSRFFFTPRAFSNGVCVSPQELPPDRPTDTPNGKVRRRARRKINANGYDGEHLSIDSDLRDDLIGHEVDLMRAAEESCPLPTFSAPKVK